MLKRFWNGIGHYRVAYFCAGTNFAMLVNQDHFSWRAFMSFFLMVVLLVLGWTNEKARRRTAPDLLSGYAEGPSVMPHRNHTINVAKEEKPWQ